MEEIKNFKPSMDEVDDSDVLSVSQLQKRSWDRDDIPQRLDDIQQSHNNIESNLQDILSELDNTKSLEELKDEYEGFFEQVKTDSTGNPKAYPPEVVDELQKRQRLWSDFARWQARSKELNRFARKMVGGKYKKLLEEYRTAQTYETLEDAIENKAEHFAEQKVSDLSTEFDSKIQQLEKLLQVVREQEKNHLEINKELARQANGVDESGVEDLVGEMENFLEDFVDEHGMVVLDDEKLKSARKRVERDEASESAVEDQVNEALDEDSEVGMSIRDEIVADWDDLETMSVQDIADLYDVDESLVETVIDEEDLSHAST